MAFPLTGRMPHTFAGPGLRVGIPGDESRPAVGLGCDGLLFRMRRKRGAHDYEPSTWRRLARAVHDKQVPGGHNTCVTTFAGVVANELQGIFAGRNSGRRMR